MLWRLDRERSCGRDWQVSEADWTLWILSSIDGGRTPPSCSHYVYRASVPATMRALHYRHTSILRSANQTALPVWLPVTNGWHAAQRRCCRCRRFNLRTRPGDSKGSGRLAEPVIRAGVLDGGVGSHPFARSTGSMDKLRLCGRSLLLLLGQRDKGTKGRASCSRQGIAMYVLYCTDTASPTT